jgi:hypothetical protein
MVVCLGEQGLESDYPVFMDWRCGSSGGVPARKHEALSSNPSVREGVEGKGRKKEESLRSYYSSFTIFTIYYSQGR